MEALRGALQKTLLARTAGARAPPAATARAADDDSASPPPAAATTGAKGEVGGVDLPGAEGGGGGAGAAPPAAPAAPTAPPAAAAPAAATTAASAPASSSLLLPALPRAPSPPSFESERARVRALLHFALRLESVTTSHYAGAAPSALTLTSSSSSFSSSPASVSRRRAARAPHLHLHSHHSSSHAGRSAVSAKDCVPDPDGLSAALRDPLVRARAVLARLQEVDAAFFAADAADASAARLRARDALTPSGEDSHEMSVLRPSSNGAAGPASPASPTLGPALSSQFARALAETDTAALAALARCLAAQERSRALASAYRAKLEAVQRQMRRRDALAKDVERAREALAHAERVPAATPMQQHAQQAAALSFHNAQGAYERVNETLLRELTGQWDGRHAEAYAVYRLMAGSLRTLFAELDGAFSRALEAPLRAARQSTPARAAARPRLDRGFVCARAPYERPKQLPRAALEALTALAARAPAAPFAAASSAHALLRLLFDPEFDLADALAKTAPPETTGRLADALVAVLGAAGAVVGGAPVGVRWAEAFAHLTIGLEIARAGDEPALLLRGNTFATKLLSAFGCRFAHAYLVAALEPPLRAYLALDGDVELDWGHLHAAAAAVGAGGGAGGARGAEDLPANLVNLLRVTKLFLVGIVEAAPKCDPAVRRLCAFLDAAAQQRFPGVPGVGERAVGAFIFLRLFNPAIASTPTGVGLPAVPPVKRRGLVAVAKLMQILAARGAPGGVGGVGVGVGGVSPGGATDGAAPSLLKQFLDAHVRPVQRFLASMAQPGALEEVGGGGGGGDVVEEEEEEEGKEEEGKEDERETRAGEEEEEEEDSRDTALPGAGPRFEFSRALAFLQTHVVAHAAVLEAALRLKESSALPLFVECCAQQEEEQEQQVPRQQGMQ